MECPKGRDTPPIEVSLLPEALMRIFCFVVADIHEVLNLLLERRMKASEIIHQETMGEGKKSKGRCGCR